MNGQGPRAAMKVRHLAVSGAILSGVLMGVGTDHTEAVDAQMLLSSQSLTGSRAGAFSELDLIATGSTWHVQLIQKDRPCLSGPRPGRRNAPFGFEVVVNGILVGISSNSRACIHEFERVVPVGSDITIRVFNYEPGRSTVYELFGGGVGHGIDIAAHATLSMNGACNWRVMAPTYEDFKACSYRESPTGPWIVDEDLSIYSESDLRNVYDNFVLRTNEPRSRERTTAAGVSRDPLIVKRSGDLSDSRWPDERVCNIRYCISEDFGAHYNLVLRAMSEATAAWSAVSNVRFEHARAQDSSCTGNNAEVDFDIRPTSDQPYLARSFFPDDPRWQRNILVNSTAFDASDQWDLLGLFEHELGHTLGFMHEHIRPEARPTGRCMSSSDSWRPLTNYDSASVMHYPQCGGRQVGPLRITAQDAAGALALYGAPSSCGATGETVDCQLFDDGYAGITGPYQALSTRALYLWDTPDTFSDNLRRAKWFGRCVTTHSRTPVEMRVFDDGVSNPSNWTDAVYIARVALACAPDGSSRGFCGKWFGEFQTTTGSPVACFLFNDGGKDMVGPTRAIYFGGGNEVCMPDGTSDGTCRRWWGQCIVQ